MQCYAMMMKFMCVWISAQFCLANWLTGWLVHGLCRRSVIIYFLFSYFTLTRNLAVAVTHSSFSFNLRSMFNSIHNSFGPSCGRLVWVYVCINWNVVSTVVVTCISHHRVLYIYILPFSKSMTIPLSLSLCLWLCTKIDFECALMKSFWWNFASGQQLSKSNVCMAVQTTYTLMRYVFLFQKVAIDATVMALPFCRLTFASNTPYSYISLRFASFILLLFQTAAAWEESISFLKIHRTLKNTFLKLFHHVCAVAHRPYVTMNTLRDHWSDRVENYYMSF